MKKINVGDMLNYTFQNGIKYILPVAVNALLFAISSIVLVPLLWTAPKFMVGTALSIAREEEIKVGGLFNNLGEYSPLIGPFLGVSLLVGLGVGFGMILLIVPGIILALMWNIAAFIVVDHKIPVIDAMKVSAALTKGNRWDLFLGLFVVNFLISVASGIVGLVPIAGSIVAGLASFAFTLSASAYVYKQLTDGVEISQVVQQIEAEKNAQ